MNREYKNLIFTKHALERLGDRNISKDAVWQVVNYPETFHNKGKKGKATKFIRSLNDRKYHVVANYLPKKEKWLVVSVWVRGEEDKKSAVWLLITFPFKIGWWVLQEIWKVVKKKK